MEQKSNAFLEQESIGILMRKYSVPCIISLVVAALYNIVDQIFIANADYLGSYGNAANTVVFPLTVVALAIAVMIGDGACAFVSISLGQGNKERHCAVSGGQTTPEVVFVLKRCALCWDRKLAHIIALQLQKGFLPQNSASISGQAPI